MYGGFEYQAASWAKPRRVVAKVEWHPGALFPRVGFVVINCRWSLTGSSASTISAARQSSPLLRMQTGDQLDTPFLQLHALAYNLGVFLQGAELPEEIADWSLTSLQTRLIKIGARVVRHARAITFQLAEVAISGDLLNASWRRSSGYVHRRFPHDCASDKT